MDLPDIDLLTREEIEDELENIENKKLFIVAIDLIRLIEVNRSIQHSLLNGEVGIVKYLCEKKDNKIIFNKITEILKQRDLMQVNSVVNFANSPFTIVKRNGRNLDIKQNFSLGIIYEKVDISEVTLIN